MGLPLPNCGAGPGLCGGGGSIAVALDYGGSVGP